MLNLNKPIVLSREQKEAIAGFGNLTKDHWDRRKKLLKNRITASLKKVQGCYCAYCGCKETYGDVDHIAPKSLYEAFIFEPLNLVYTCKTCNQIYKQTTDVVSVHSDVYENCEFRMVHPYLDDVEYYFDTKDATITINRNLTYNERRKALYTRMLFHWIDSDLVERRAKEIEYQRNHTTDIVCNSDTVSTYKPPINLS